MGNFSLDLAQFAEDATKANEKIARESAIRLFNMIVIATPFDKGFAKNNWFPSAKKPSAQTTKDGDISGQKAIDRIRIKVQGLADVDIIQLTNNLPYIKRLEDGYSEQAPAGMVKTSITAFEQILEDEARKRKI